MNLLPATRRTLLIGGGATLAATSISKTAPANAAVGLRGPVDVERRRKLLGRPMLNYGCPRLGPPVRDLSVEGAYVDRAASIIDPEKARKMAEVTRPLGIFSYEVAHASDVWLLALPAASAPATCALSLLDSWASADALMGRLDTPDAQHQRRWVLGGVALAYLKFRDQPGLDPDARRRIERWFTRLADAATDYYGKWGRNAYTNHIHWWALALAAVSVATADHAMFDHAITIYRGAMEDIQPDGTLPLEMGRKSRALGYHVFALTPLVMIAEIGEANGLKLYDEQGGAIHRLAKRVQAGLDDPAWFSARAGAEQEYNGKPDKFTYVWAEPYYARFPDPELGRKIAAGRPWFYAWLGGSTTDDFGSPNLPFPHQ
jgi:poly(beta-D-mannuronate) lyase